MMAIADIQCIPERRGKRWGDSFDRERISARAEYNSVSKSRSGQEVRNVPVASPPHHRSFAIPRGLVHPREGNVPIYS